MTRELDAALARLAKAAYDDLNDDEEARDREYFDAADEVVRVFLDSREIGRAMTAEHDADVAYYQREVWHVAQSVDGSHPERAELFAEVRRLAEVRELIRQVGGFPFCPGEGCTLLGGHAGVHAHSEVPALTLAEQMYVAAFRRAQ